MKNVKNFEEFKTDLLNNPTLQQEFKNDPVTAISSIKEKNPLTGDVWVYRIVVITLGAVILTITIGVIILVATDQIKKDEQVPTILTAIGSAAIGALAGLLTPTVK